MWVLKTHFHKGSGDLWWALLMVSDRLLKCVRGARIITQPSRTRLRGKYYVSFLWLIRVKKVNWPRNVVVFFPPMNDDEFTIARMSYEVTLCDCHKSSLVTWAALLWNVCYWARCVSERPLQTVLWLTPQSLLSHLWSVKALALLVFWQNLPKANSPTVCLQATTKVNKPCLLL